MYTVVCLLAIQIYKSIMVKYIKQFVNRKFMPKVSATQYCNHLRQLITSIGDFYGKGKKFGELVPECLEKYEIVVEP